MNLLVLSVLPLGPRPQRKNKESQAWERIALIAVKWLKIKISEKFFLGCVLYMPCYKDMRKFSIWDKKSLSIRAESSNHVRLECGTQKEFLLKKSSLAKYATEMDQNEINFQVLVVLKYLESDNCKNVQFEEIVLFTGCH